MTLAIPLRTLLLPLAFLGGAFFIWAQVETLLLRVVGRITIPNTLKMFAHVGVEALRFMIDA